MFNSRLCNAATIRYCQLKFGHMHLCGMNYKCFSPHCCKCNSFGCTAAITYGNACHGPHSDSLYSGNEHSQFNSPRLVKREAGFPTPDGRWLAQTNYDALMTHHTTENSAPSHYLNQCWVIINWTLRNIIQWNFDQNKKLFIHENSSENVVCERGAILSRGEMLCDDIAIRICIDVIRPGKVPEWIIYHRVSIYTYTVSQLKSTRFGLTHWGRDKMAAIFQTTFSSAFSWMKMFKFD